MNTSKQIYNRLLEMCTHILFDYNGHNCGIDPLSKTTIDMWYGDIACTVSSVDEAMNYPLFNGKTINEISEDIKNLEL